MSGARSSAKRGRSLWRNTHIVTPYVGLGEPERQSGVLPQQQRQPRYSYAILDLTGGRIEPRLAWYDDQREIEI